MLKTTADTVRRIPINRNKNMTEKKKIVKTVNRSGKALIKKALVVKAKKQSKISVENIKKLNEKKLEEKAILAKAS